MNDPFYRKCRVCKFTKRLDKEFNNKKVCPNGKDTRCRDCSKKDAKEQYIAKGMKESQIKKNKQRKLENRSYIYYYQMDNGCIDCGEKDPRVLEFDHRDPATKTRDISAMLRAVCGLDTIKTEIAKCDIRCANCHRRKTAIGQGWYKDILPRQINN